MNRSRTTPLGHPSPATGVEQLSDHLGAAAVALGPGSSRGGEPGLDLRDDRGAGLVEAADRLRRVEIILDGVAADADMTVEGARQLRSLRDAVSVHLSAAASLRLLDMDAKAAAVLRRAVESVRGSMTDLGNVPDGIPVYEAG